MDQHRERRGREVARTVGGGHCHGRRPQGERGPGRLRVRDRHWTNRVRRGCRRVTHQRTSRARRLRHDVRAHRRYDRWGRVLHQHGEGCGGLVAALVRAGHGHDGGTKREQGPRGLGVGDRIEADLAVSRCGHVVHDRPCRHGCLDHEVRADKCELRRSACAELGRDVWLLGQDKLAGDRQDDRLASRQIAAWTLVPFVDLAVLVAWVLFVDAIVLIAL